MNSGFTFNKLAALKVERPTLDQYLLLSLMLHVLAIVLFGDTSGASARKGEKLWGALTVTVQSLLPDRNAQLKTDADISFLQRSAAAMRSAPAASQTITAARATAALAPAEPIAPAEETNAALQLPSVEMPPLISTEVDKPVTEFVVPKASLDRVPNLSTLTPLSPPIAPFPPETSPVIAIPEPVKSSKTERGVVKPAVAESEPNPREVLPAPAPAITAAPVDTMKPEPVPAQAIAPPAELKPREPPAVVPIAPTPVAPVASRPAEAPQTPQIERAFATPDAAPAKTKAAPSPAATSGPPGMPNVASEPASLRDNIIAPSINPPALGKAPGIDLDAVRRRAREIGVGGPRTIFPFPVAPPPTPKTKVQEAFDKALKKNDCRNAYADLGLAAVVPLVLSSVREDGCKW